MRGTVQWVLAQHFAGTPWGMASVVVNQDERTIDVVASDGTKATFSEKALVASDDTARLIIGHIDDVAAHAGHLLRHLNVRRGPGATRSPLCDAGLRGMQWTIDLDDVTCPSCLAAVGDYAVGRAARTLA